MRARVANFLLALIGLGLLWIVLAHAPDRRRAEARELRQAMDGEHSQLIEIHRELDAMDALNKVAADEIQLLQPTPNSK